MNERICKDSGTFVNFMLSPALYGSLWLTVKWLNQKRKFSLFVFRTAKKGGDDDERVGNILSLSTMILEKKDLQDRADGGSHLGRREVHSRAWLRREEMTGSWLGPGKALKVDCRKIVLILHWSLILKFRNTPLLNNNSFSLKCFISVNGQQGLGVVERKEIFWRKGKTNFMRRNELWEQFSYSLYLSNIFSLKWKEIE